MRKKEFAVNKKIILLVLILPIFLMVSLFAATRTVSLAVEVPVSGIEILGEPIVYLDLDQDETYRVDYAVYPTNAKNRKVTFSTEAVGDGELCELIFSQGEIVPQTAGIAKVTLTTVDGGFSDSFIVEVSSGRLSSIECSVEKSTLSVGETVSVSTVFKPASASNLLLTYSSSNPLVATVDGNGVIRGVGRGNAVITVTSEADPSIKDTVAITVSQEEQLVFSEGTVATAQKTGSLNLSVRDEHDYTYTYTAVDKNGQALASDRFRLSFDTSNAANGHILVNYELLDTAYLGKVTVTVTASFGGAALSESCEIVFANDFEIAFSQEVIALENGKNTAVSFTVTPSNAAVNLSATLSNGNASVLPTSGGRIDLYTQKAGVSVLTLTATDPLTGVSKTETVTLVIKPTSLYVKESISPYGVENRLAVGGREADGSPNRFGLSLEYDQTKVQEGFGAYLSFVTDNPMVTVNENGVLLIAEDFVGEVTVRGVFSAHGVRSESAPMTVLCVGNGRNVRSFKELYETVNAGLPVVLMENIVDDFGYIDGAMFYTEETVEKIHTTYDDTFYKNGGREDEAFVKVLLSFRNDLYGNGYAINAGNVTMQLDGIGALKPDALFRGPLNFVSLTDNMASVKAQDNICFALYEGVSVRNVTLQGCTLSNETGAVDLTDLDYVGTTVEVLGDGVEILYSRVENGRTVLRVFGDAEDASKKITVNISNSVLGYAREFILRMGSNAFVDPEGESFASARLPGDNGQVFPAQKTYALMSPEEKAAYDEAFVKTYVNVKNSVFTEAGIFAVGIDSHFSGMYLDRGSTAVGPTFASLVPEWHDLAKTSYGAKLTFEGDVRLYSWKDLSMIDSSTLIEVNEALTENHPELDLRLNVADMVNTVAKKPNFGNIVYNKNGKQFAHAGITFFGGGYNYGVFEYKNPANPMFAELTGYEINLADADKEFLNSAAGNESFYFLLANANSSFSLEEQERLLASEDGFDFIKRRDE